jgi:hypothetical protein
MLVPLTERSPSAAFRVIAKVPCNAGLDKNDGRPSVRSFQHARDPCVSRGRDYEAIPASIVYPRSINIADTLRQQWLCAGLPIAKCHHQRAAWQPCTGESLIAGKRGPCGPLGDVSPTRDDGHGFGPHVVPNPLPNPWHPPTEGVRRPLTPATAHLFRCWFGPRYGRTGNAIWTKTPRAIP